ncbi:GTP 3',8-cyclase MoaA [Acinetobacter sp. B51(2017)]|uniref:GTP 3',8-cyclase MoaA n=1 Tax=Acinetobacter sp. B51(2017) TaxID=2060938 RepID=UPI000F08486B|nr:GTP 3',8-cyclase MoaA [Acinetobacter sp. B51(2017)]
MTSLNVLQQLNIFKDQFGREKRKLRISVTDRCNFKCVYCMPEHPKWMAKHQLLSFEELYQFCDFMVQRGIEHIRITGGEPLMRQGVVHFIAQLQSLKKKGLKKVSMTTNGHYLKQYVKGLKQAGLDDINISLDSLDQDQFFQLTQRQIEPVLQGIHAAKEAGLKIKINTVLIKNLNENQIIPLVRWSIQHNVQLRFIEYMPLDGDGQWSHADVVSEQEILAILSQFFVVNEDIQQGSNPARQYFIQQHPIGIISTISHSFCKQCNRLRLNAQGEFFNCLFAKNGLNIKSDIQQLVTHPKKAQHRLDAQLGHYIWHKERGYHAIQTKPITSNRKISMYQIGG